MTELAERSPLDMLRALEAEGKVTRTALLLTEALPFEQFEALCRYLGTMSDSIGFWMGDAALYGEQQFGEAAAQALEAMGRSPDALQRYVRVAQQVPPGRRRPGLSWSHHREVAPLEPADQDEWLERAEANQWTRRELEAQMRKAPEPESTRTPCPECGGKGWVA